MRNINHFLRSMLLSALALTSISALADDATQSALVLQRTDATTETFAFDTMPVVSFADANCVIESQVATVTTARADISDLHFTRVSSSTDGIKAAAGSTVASIKADGAMLYGVDAAAVRVCDISGKAVGATVSRQGDATVVSLSSLAPGIYIINYGRTSIKIRK